MFSQWGMGVLRTSPRRDLLLEKLITLHLELCWEFEADVGICRLWMLMWVVGSRSRRFPPVIVKVNTFSI